MKKAKAVSRRISLTTFLVAGIISIIAGGVTGYSLAFTKYNPNRTPSDNVPGYITVDEARGQVKGFYEQYLRPRESNSPVSRQAIIRSYGTKNLLFYSQYYQHGFDPIVCSTTMPSNVTTKNVTPGAGALVTAEARYPDGSTADIDVTLVLNRDGFGIDTITCPGDKGNLPPLAQ